MPVLACSNNTSHITHHTSLSTQYTVHSTQHTAHSTQHTQRALLFSLLFAVPGLPGAHASFPFQLLFGPADVDLKLLSALPTRTVVRAGSEESYLKEEGGRRNEEG